MFSQRATSKCINPWNLSRRLVNLWSVAHCLKSVNLPDFSVYMVCVYDVCVCMICVDDVWGVGWESWRQFCLMRTALIKRARKIA